MADDLGDSLAYYPADSSPHDSADYLADHEADDLADNLGDSRADCQADSSPNDSADYLADGREDSLSDDRVDNLADGRTDSLADDSPDSVEDDLGYSLPHAGVNQAGYAINIGCAIGCVVFSLDYEYMTSYS